MTTKTSLTIATTLVIAALIGITVAPSGVLDALNDPAFHQSYQDACDQGKCIPDHGHAWTTAPWVHLAILIGLIVCASCIVVILSMVGLIPAPQEPEDP